MIGSSSNSSSNGLPMNPKAAEAELLSRATQTAIIAARSILMAGGSEEVALKTAKAAAESVLNPSMASDSDTISGRSTLGGAFGGKKRKAKRQAEVVASMALMSASSAHPNGSGTMGECDSFNNPFGRNIITVRQDEPSVLSGSISTRPPRIPTPKSKASHNSVMGRSQQEETRDGVPNQRNTITSELSPRSYTRNGGSRLSISKQSHTSPQPLQNSRRSSASNRNGQKSAKEEEIRDDVLRELDSNTFSQSSTMDSDHQRSVESSVEGRSESEDESDAESDSIHVRDHLEEKEQEKEEGVSKKKGSWSLAETLMSPFTAIFHCGQISSGEAAGDVEILESYEKDKFKRFPERQARRDRQQYPIVDSRDDTFDDQTTSSSYETNHKGDYRDRDFATSYSETSTNAPSAIADDSEGDIQVRSSIRETMESIVSKSKTSYRNSKNDDNKWSSYEMRQKNDGNKKSKRASGSSRRTPPSSLITSPKNNSSKRASKVVLSPVNSVRSVSKRATSFFKKNKDCR